MRPLSTGPKLVVALLSGVWLLAMLAQWSHALSPAKADSFRELTHQTEARWAWRLLSLSESLPYQSLTRRFLRGWANLVTPAELGAPHLIWVDSAMLHVALQMGALIGLSIVVGSASLVWWLRHPCRASHDSSVTLWLCWGGYVGWFYASLCAWRLVPGGGGDNIDGRLQSIALLQLLGLVSVLLVRPGAARLLRIRPVHLLWGFGGFGLAFPLAWLTQWIQGQLGVSGSGDLTIYLVSHGAPEQLKAALGLVSVLTPLAEELWYRGALLEALRERYRNPAALILSALLFAFAHGDPGAFLPLSALGIVFGYLYLRTGSVMPGVIAHGLWNATTFILVRLAVV